MNFIHHNYLGDVELTKKETQGIRLYNLPNGDWVPSITSVTSFYNRQIFADWRKRVGIEEANRITKKATSRGTDFHAATELYMLNKEIDWNEFKPLTKIMFAHARPYLDKINNIHAIERTLYSEYLGLAGRVDCIGEYEGELAVIDFKTSEKIKPEKWLENYFVQEMFYASAYYEMTGISVKKLITIMVTPSGEVEVFDKRNKEDYIKLLVRYIKEFVHHNTGQKMENDLEKVLEKKFYCPSRFTQEIENVVLDNEDMSYIDAVVFFCEQNNIDVESVSKLISKPLKEKIKGEAMELNFLKRSSRAKLPL